VGGSVDEGMESVGRPAPALEIRLLGPLTVSRDGVALPFPTSRKVRALLAYLALAPHPTTRSHLCALLWDVPNDPRGELRWCLSKIRGLIDDPDRRRVQAQGESVALDLKDCLVDAREIARADRDGLASIGLDRLKALEAFYVGDFLDGLEMDRSPAFESWLVVQRRRFRELRDALLQHLVASMPHGEAGHYLDKWLRHAPFDLRPHEALFARLTEQGKIRDAEEHLSATVKLFASEGIDSKPLKDIWQRVRTPGAASSSFPQPAAAPQPTTADQRGEPTPDVHRRSVAVMPFADMSAAAVPGGLSDALVHDVITRLAKLRNLRVIAQGTVFALRDQRIGPEEAGRLLAVDYIVSGSVQWRGSRVVARIELAETVSSRIVWAEVLDHAADDTFLLLDEIGNQIVSSVDREIETMERNRAVLKPPNSLDAWEAHHRGLWHMYRFTKADNDQARHFFETATRTDPTFARAHAGLSFTHWQDAFQGWSDRSRSIDLAYAAAGQSVMTDDRDPAAHWAMGRALWLRNQHDQSVGELSTAVDLSPNFALGHYSLAFVHSQSGDPAKAIVASDYSRELSPFDPLLFGMLASRAMALVRLDRFDEAANWGVKAALRPNAHAHIVAIAAMTLALAGRIDEARSHLAAIRSKMPNYQLGDFFQAFHLEPQAQAKFRAGAKYIDLA
jgi:DNA-binding SARP family transcriptional activator